ncbi:MAG: hypothetical protein Q4E75_02785 [bacterium]|nr:hypothetical protein [bacterium]
MKIKVYWKKIIATLALGTVLVTSTGCATNDESKGLIVDKSSYTIVKDSDAKNCVFPRQLASIKGSRNDEEANYLYMINSDYIKSDSQMGYNGKLESIPEVLYVIRSVTTFSSLFNNDDDENFENIRDVETMSMASGFFNRYCNFIVPDSYSENANIFYNDNLFQRKCNFTLFGSNLGNYYYLYDCTLTAKEDICKNGMPNIEKGNRIRNTRLLKLNLTNSNEFSFEEVLSTQSGIGSNDSNVLLGVKNNYTEDSIVPISFSTKMEPETFENVNELNEYLVKNK